MENKLYIPIIEKYKGGITMLSEEEKKAIERLNEILKEWQEIVNIEDKTEREIEMSLYMEDMPFEEIKTVLNIITKLQKENEYIHKELDKQQTTINNYAKENEEKDKQIDLMAEALSAVCTGISSVREQLEKCYCEFINSNEDCCWKTDRDCKDCIFEYFEKLAKEKGE